MIMDPAYRERIVALDDGLSEYAKKSTESLGRKHPIPEDPFRTPFERDLHRVLHSLPFRRLKHKTQVFFSPQDDHICTRLEHSLHVASISSTICKRLRFNSTLAEAIALAHDLGHPPFGHVGEKALSAIHDEHNRKRSDSMLPPFYHEAQSLRVIDLFGNSLHEPLHLTYEVRDGVVCHCGERSDPCLRPQYDKDLRSVDISSARKQLPATIEGCVARVADAISYLGRDFEDAHMAGLLSQEDLPTNLRVALAPDDTRNINSQIIGTLITDLVRNSLGEDCLRFSSEVYEAMTEMKRFNYDRIYYHPKLAGQDKRIYLILSELFAYFLSVLEDASLLGELSSGNYPNRPCQVFSRFLEDMEYSAEINNGQIVSDFVAGMSDNFALNCFSDLFTVQAVV